MTLQLININMAEKVANILRRISKVQDVELFGSLAREGKGEDIDLILICDEDTSQIFMHLVEIEARHSILRNSAWYHNLAQNRSHIAENLLDPEGDGMFEEIWDENIPVDIFIFPPDWRNRLEELQSRIPHDDPKFMENIAQDARPIA